MKRAWRREAMAISFDANIIIYSLNTIIPEHDQARSFLLELSERDDVVIAEQVLVEVYLLIRNPVVFPNPYSSKDAAQVCESYRSNPHWRLVECMPVMREVWLHAAATAFARRRIIDARLALTLRAAGVTELATRNVKDFSGFGFERIWDPVG
jgi:toxin-antitoxin system PIN domain toxin